jgi:hypothetical protein
MHTRSAEPPPAGVEAEPSPRERPGIEDYLERRKVSELQEMWGFGNGSKAPARTELVARS